MVVIGNSIKRVNPNKKQTDYSDLTLKEQDIQYKLESHNKSSETETETVDLGLPEEQDIKYKIESHKDSSDSSSVDGDDMEITINEVQDILENKDINSSLMKSGLEKSFEILKGKIASTRANAANGEWIDPEKIKTKWWIDETLRFKRSEKNPDTYCIYQKDSKGEWVAMGWTDAETAFAYSQDAKQRMVGTGKYYQTDKFGNTWEVTYDPQTGKILKGEHSPNTSVQNGGTEKYYQTDKFGNTWEVTYDPQTGKILKGEHSSNTGEQPSNISVQNDGTEKYYQTDKFGNTWEVTYDPQTGKILKGEHSSNTGEQPSNISVQNDGTEKYYQTDKFGNTWEVTRDPQTGKILKGEHKGTTNLSDISIEKEIPDIEKSETVDDSSNTTSYVPDDGNSIEDIDASGSTYVNSSEIPESVQNEIKDYIHKITYTDKTNPSEQQNAYNSLSDDAKKIIDGKVKIVNIAEKSVKDMMINQEDIIIPKGKNLYVNGGKVIGSDCTFRYDSNTQKYRLVTSNGGFAAGGYTVNELYESEIK